MISEKRQRCTYIVSDLLTSGLAWFLFNVIRFNDVVAPRENYPPFADFLSVKPVWLGLICFPLLMLGIYYLSGYYNKVFIKSRVEELIHTLSTAIIGTIVIYFIAIVNDPIPDRASNYVLLLILMGLMFSLVYIGRLSITSATNRKISRGELRFNTLIIGTSQYAVALREKLMTSSTRANMTYNIIGFVEPDQDHCNRQLPLPVYPIEDIEMLCRELDVKCLIATSHRNGMQATLDLVNRLFRLDLPIMISPSLFQLITSKPQIRRLAGEPLIDISHAEMSDSTVNLKRAGDIVVSAITLLFLLPVFAVIAIAIKKDSKGPVIYSQERIGLRKKPFRIYKFRTMHTDAEANGPALSSANDERITHIGRILRKYRLDELPQFWNVLKGDMSIIGPRPERAYYIDKIMERAPYYILVHQVRPGITSLGMVKHGYASTIDEMIDRLQYDLIYIENISLIVDLKIIMYTVNTVLTGKGV